MLLKTFMLAPTESWMHKMGEILTDYGRVGAVGAVQSR